MSKLSKQIKAMQLGQYQYVQRPSPIAINYSERPISEGLMVDYRHEKIKIDATFGCQVLVRSDKLLKDYEIMRARETVRQYVIEEVFGEFRIDLRMLRVCILNYEYEKALDCLDNIEKEMFDV